VKQRRVYLGLEADGTIVSPSNCQYQSPMDLYADTRAFGADRMSLLGGAPGMSVWYHPIPGSAQGCITLAAIAVGMASRQWKPSGPVPDDMGAGGPPPTYHESDDNDDDSDDGGGVGVVNPPSVRAPFNVDPASPAIERLPSPVVTQARERSSSHASNPGAGQGGVRPFMQQGLIQPTPPSRPPVGFFNKSPTPDSNGPKSPPVDSPPGEHELSPPTKHLQRMLTSTFGSRRTINDVSFRLGSSTSLLSPASRRMMSPSSPQGTHGAKANDTRRPERLWEEIGARPPSTSSDDSSIEDRNPVVLSTVSQLGQELHSVFSKSRLLRSKSRRSPGAVAARAAGTGPRLENVVAPSASVMSTLSSSSEERGMNPTAAPLFDDVGTRGMYLGGTHPHARKIACC